MAWVRGYVGVCRRDRSHKRRDTKTQQKEDHTHLIIDCSYQGFTQDFQLGGHIGFSVGGSHRIFSWGVTVTRASKKARD